MRILLLAIICAMGVALQLSPLKPSRIAIVPSMSMNSAHIAKKTMSALIAVSLGLTLVTSDGISGIIGGSSSSSFVAHAQDDQSIFVGKYLDPNHPEGSRVITAKVIHGTTIE